MSPITAAVLVFWGFVALFIVRMLVRAKAESTANEQVEALSKKLDALRVGPRLDELESGHRALNSKIESAKVTPIRRRGWGQ